MDDVFQSCTTDELGLALATREISAMNETRMSISQPYNSGDTMGRSRRRETLDQCLALITQIRRTEYVLVSIAQH